MPGSHQHIFDQCKACVLLPTYNNAGTLADVLHSVLGYTGNIIVVNDGSTDGTREILEGFTDVQVVNYTPNRGKGFALRTGIKEAAKLGYDYAISIDSDGQHYASDLPAFLEQLQQTPNALIIGARNLTHENVPGKSSFGNRFSNFWYRVETGNKLPDTQSGYRLYPVKELAAMNFITRKYEFEIEVIVRAAWKGMPILSIPVSVYYPPPGERVSHFRPFKDFTRISILNTVLVLIALLYIKPRDFLKLLVSKEGWAKIWRAIFVNPNESNHLKAASIGFGIFMGIVPIWGFQLLVGISLAILFKLNKGLVILAAHISVFPFTPVIWALSLLTGKWVLGYHQIMTDWSHISFDIVKKDSLAFFLGGSVLATTMGIFTYLLVYGILAVTRKPGEVLIIKKEL